MTLTALIADDEPLARALVREYLAAHPAIQVVAEAADGLEATRLLDQCQPDLVFLDIQMPRLNGLELLQQTGRQRGVIFTTAHDQHALAAFDLHAVDYLLKPFSQARFDAAVQRALQWLPGTSPAVAGLVAGQPLRRVLVRDGAETRVLPLAEVDLIEAQADYVGFHHGGRLLLKAQRMAELESQLDPDQFVRVHRGYIVALAAIEALERTPSQGVALRLRGGQRVPVSRAGHERLRQKLHTAQGR